MANRYDIVRIDFQANAGKANVAIDTMRAKAKASNEELQRLRKNLETRMKLGATTEELDKIRAQISEASKAAAQWSKGYKELLKGVRALDEGVKAFNDGTLGQMNAAFQKTVANAAKLAKSKMDRGTEEWRQMSALIQETEQNYARLQLDTENLIAALKNGGSVARNELTAEINGLKQLMEVLPVRSREYQTSSRNLAILQARLKEMGGGYDYVRQHMTDTRKVSDEMLRSMYSELEKINAEGKVTKDMLQQNKQAMKEIRAEQARRVENVLGGNLGNQSEQSIRTAIANAKELLSHYKTNSSAAQTLTAQIVNAEDHLRKYGVEGVRAAAREKAALESQIQKEKELTATMKARLSSLSTLSADALAETRKYWEAQRNGADAGSNALNKYESILKRITAEERQRKAESMKAVLTTPGQYGVAEVRTAVAEMEKLRDGVKRNSAEWKTYNQLLIQGKTYLDNLAKSEALARVEGQMKQLSILSATGISEVRRYWESMVAGAEHGSQELNEYKTKLQEVIAEEQRRNMESAKQKVGVLSGSLGRYSEAEIRAAIEAGNKLIVTYKTSSTEAQRLAQNIVRAEEYLKQYGVEAERAAAKEAKAVADAAKKRAETDSLMEGQLKRNTSLTESALRAQEQYWQRLIDDPKTAADSLAKYYQNLNKVHQIQKQQAADAVQTKGLDALTFFRGDTSNASAAQIEEQARALRTYRDSLPRKSNAATIEEINKYLAQSANEAKTASGETMSLAEALGYTASISSNPASVNQLKLAKKAIEEAKNAVGEGTAEYLNYEEALNAINLQLARTSKLSGDVERILNNPKGKSFNELKIAVEQGRAALNSMGQETDEEKQKFDELSKKVKEADFQMKQLAGSSKGTATAFEKAWSRLKTYIGLYVGAAVAMQKLVSTLGDLMEFSDRLGEVRKTTGFTEEQVGRLSNSLATLDTRTAITGLMELSVAAGQLGLKTEEDVRGFTEAANMLMVALPEMGREGATQMLKVALATGEIDKIRKQLQEGTVEGNDAVSVAMTKIGSTIDQLRASSAAAAPAITDFVQRVGAVGAQSGISIDQVAALGSTVDALGMRVEMSATALSRMIPAIKNNAFDIAKAIGVTPETIRNLFDTGRGMEAILMILQHIKDSGADSEGIEKMLGMGGMADIMKDLNQQGARAGIVFAGLSQNVGELRRQLGVAAEAYEKNTAIQNEYNKMNDTTAAKWTRLKNQVSEMFVSDTAQRWLGNIIDGARKLINVLVGSNGLSVAIWTILTYWGMMRIGLGEGLVMMFVKLKNMVVGLGVALKSLGATMKAMTAAQWANVFVATIAAVSMLIYKIIQLRNDISLTSEAFSKAQEEIKKQTDDLEKLFYATEKTSLALEKAKTKLEEATKAGKGTEEAEKELTKANNAHVASIREINNKYGQYLGYMLSETTSAEQLAKARELINAKLRETIYLKQREAAMGNVEQEYGGEANKRMARLEENIRKSGKYLSMRQQARLSMDIAAAAQKYVNDAERFEREVTRMLKDLGLSEKGGGSKALVILESAKKYRDQLEEMAKAEADVDRRFNAKLEEAQVDSRKRAVETLNQIRSDWQNVLSQYQKAEGDEKERLAVEVYKQQRSYINLFENNSEYFSDKKTRETIEKNIASMKAYEKGLRAVADESIKAVDATERAQTKIHGVDLTNNGESDKNPWGRSQSGESTDYAKMNAEALVARRHQMEAFVNAIQEDSDVQSVLKEDKALQKAIEEGLSSDMRTVIAWYNTERLKIQEELKNRNLTNEGKWRDPEKGGSKKKQVMSEEALAELERYYAWRKEMMEDSRIAEGLSEEEFNRKLDALEEEHLQKRRDLRYSFTSEDQAFIQNFRNWWESVAELDEVEWSGIEAEWRVATDREIKTNNMKAAKDLANMKAITVKHLNAIANILAQERPYDGITRNLQDNLTKMGILFADLDALNKSRISTGLEPFYSDSDYVQKNTERLRFLLSEAENAYSASIEDVLSRMADAGMESWAYEISKSDAMKNALMAQLRTAYDAIQDAIKREANVIRKQVQIQWNDTLLGNGQSQKQAYEAAISRLGLQGEAVRRANSLISAGAASERVADKIAIKQMQVKLRMQEAYYAMIRKIGLERIEQLEAEGKMEDAAHIRKSLDLALSEEQKKVDEQRVAIANQLEESQNRLYTELREWGELIANGLKGVFEASNTGQAEFYNEEAKARLTGSGDGSQQYVVIDNAGTEDATASYQILSRADVLDIEQRNAMADAWKQLMDDLNAKMSETITDQLNAMYQNASIDSNTTALGVNTAALGVLTEAISGGGTGGGSVSGGDAGEGGAGEGTKKISRVQALRGEVAASKEATASIEADAQVQQKVTEESNKKILTSTQSAYAKMTQAANLYGIAYQAMSNDNMSAAQKFGMIAIQSAGQAAITALTVNMSQTAGQTAAETPSVLSKVMSQLGPIGGPIAFAAFTGLLGGLLGLAASKIAKSKSEIASVTGVSASTGKLATGMLTYAEGNVNEFTSPDSLSVGRQYTVDAADGRSYRARYMGSDPRTHITTGPEFHLSGEKGREMIIDAGTTRQITMNEGEIWRAIQTLSAGGRMRHSSLVRRGRGVAAFADGNVDEFMGAGMDGGYDAEALQASLDRNSAVQEALLERLKDPIQAKFDIYGKHGLIDSYDTGKRTVRRYGQEY